MSENMILVIGTIWMPAVQAAIVYNPSSYDVENMRDGHGEITRETVGLWLDSHAGDFQSVDDFDAVLITGEGSVSFPWADEDSGYGWAVLMYGKDD